eukprot:241981-Chlamydomonas_euryale.AAC.3
MHHSVQLCQYPLQHTDHSPAVLGVLIAASITCTAMPSNLQISFPKRATRRAGASACPSAVS